MTQNKKYPIAFKAGVNSLIPGDKKLFTYDPNLDYFRSKIHYKVNRLVTSVSRKVLAITQNQLVKNIIPETSEKISQKVLKTQRNYFSQARKVLQHNNGNKSNIFETIGNYSKRIKDQKKFEDCNEGEKNIYLYGLINEFFGIPESVQLLNTYYKDDSEKKYEIIDLIVQEFEKKGGKQNQNYIMGSEQLNNIFGIEFSSREEKMKFTLSTIDTLGHHINPEIFMKLNTFSPDEGIQVAKKLYDLGIIDNFVKYYDLFYITDEEFNFQVASSISQKYPEIFARYVSNFRITNQEMLSQLAEFQKYSKINNTVLGNKDFINSAHHFFLDPKEYSQQVLSSLHYNSLPDYKTLYLKLQEKEDFGILLKKYFSICDLNFNNLTEFFDFLSSLEKPEQDRVLKDSLDGFNNRISFITTLKYLKEKNLITNPFGKTFYTEILRYQISQDPIQTFYLYSLGENTLCETKEDLENFLDILLEENIISHEMYEIIVSDDKKFENLKNFISIILSKNINQTPEKTPQKSSRDIFCEHFGIPNLTSKKYSSSDIQKFYLYSYKLYSDIFKNFSVNIFHKLQFDEQLLQSKNISKYNEFVQLLYYFTTIDKRTSQYFMKDLNFVGLLADYNLPNGVINIGFSQINIGNIDTYLTQLKDILGTILHSFFPSQNFSSTDFDTLSEKWGSIEDLFALIPYLKENGDISDIVGTVLRHEIDGTFGEYKYEGSHTNDVEQHRVKKQIGFLNDDQKNIWRKKTQEFSFYEGGGNQSDTTNETELLEKTYNHLITQKHFDELGEGMSEKINLFQGNPDVIQDIYTISKRENTLQKYGNISEEQLMCTAAKSIIQANDISQLKSAIHFFLFVTKKINKDIGSLENELKSYLGEIKNYENSNNSTKTKEQFILTLFTDNPNIALNIGNIVGGDYSCQDYKQLTAQAKALPGYIIDAGVKVLISFSLGEKDFSSQKEWKEVKKHLQNNPNNFEFNPYTRIITIQGNTYGPLRGIYRNILKLGNTHGETSVYQEKAYKNVSGDLQNYVGEIHKTTLGKIRDEMKCVPCNSSTIFPQTRNPGGIYSDHNGGIMYTEYKHNKQ